MKLQQLFLIEMIEDRKWQPIMIDTPVLIGRDSSSDVVIAHESISGEHARIVRDNENFVCIDLETTNQTRLNATKITREVMHDGDIISFGSVSYLVKIVEASFPRLYLTDENKTIAIAVIPFSIGRAFDNELVISDSSISSRHAQIEHENNQFIVEDFKSTNGTRVNGQRIRKTRLRNGDRVQFGKKEAIFFEEYMWREDYCLRYLSGECEGRVLPVYEETTFGSSENSTVLIPDKIVSPKHAVISWKMGCFWLKDLQSNNGTRLRGVRIEHAPICHGDEFAIATHSFLFFNKNRSAEKFYLVFFGGERGGEEISLEKFPFVIGRHNSCDLLLNDTEVSKKHTEIRMENENVFLIHDLGSTNGTYLHHRKIDSSVSLQHGDEIQIGGQKFVFRSSVQPRPKILQEENYILLPIEAKGYGVPVLLGATYTIGRSSENDLALASSHISRQHAIILYERGRYYIRDCKSRMGTWVNEQKINQTVLEHGDEIRLGKYRYIFKNSLQPLGKGKVLGIPTWLYAMAAAVLLLVLTAVFFMISHKPADTKDDKGTSNKTIHKKTDSELLAECSKRIQSLQRAFKYPLVLKEIKEYDKQLSNVANQQYLEEQQKNIQKDYQFFKEIIAQIQIHTQKDEIYLEFAREGKCLLVQADEEKVSFKDAAQKKFDRTWQELPVTLLFSLIDQSGLGEEKPYVVARFAMTYGDRTNVSRYLVSALQKATTDAERRKIWSLYAKVLQISIPEDGFAVYEGKLLSPAEIQKLEAEKQTRFLERQKRLQQELDKRQREENLRLDLQREREGFPIRFSMTEDFVRTYGYNKAIRQLEAMSQELRAEDLKNKVLSRIQEIKPMSRLFTNLVESINNHKLKNDRIHFGKVEGQLYQADEDRVHVKIDEGFLKRPWYSISPKELYQFFERIEKSNEEIFLVGTFCFDNNLLDEGNLCFIEYLRVVPGDKNKVDTYLAKTLGISVPEGGFVPYRGQLVTKDEAEKRRQGFVRYQGRWETPEDKKKFEAGYVKHNEKWVTVDEKKMLAQGYILYKEKWYSPTEIRKLRSNWEDAWTASTAHYEFRCNISPEFTEELSRFMECAYQEYEKFFGKTVNAKMTIYGFRTYEDYRSYCMETKQEAQLRAGGFASSRDNRGVGWMRSDIAEMMRTLIHEGAHLYQYNSYPTCQSPSWFAEGVATQFEGYRWDGKTLTMTFISPRLHLVQQVLTQKEYISITDLVQGEALDHINQDPKSAAIFYAECWGLFYFLMRSKEYQGSFHAFRQKLFDGGLATREGKTFLDEFGKNITEIEAAWQKYMLSVR